MSRLENSEFARFVGAWETHGVLMSDNSILSGTDTYEFILNNQFILHKADVHMAAEKSQTFEIISFNPTTNNFKMEYFNTKGENGIMTSTIVGNQFTIQGDNLKFEGQFQNEDSELLGKWYILTESNEWNEFIDLRLLKKISKKWN